MRRLRLFIPYALLCAACTVMAGCGDEALFDEMTENRLQVVIKGTFESNNPRPWQAFPTDDSVDTLHTPAPAPGVLRMDFAEAKLDYEPFSNYRQTFTAVIGSDADPFFNGTGVPYEVDDVKDGAYGFVRIFIRKMIMDSAKQYIEDYFGSWNFISAAVSTFDEESVYGFDFNQLQPNTYYDSMRKEAKSVNRIFPYVIPIDGGLHYNKNYPAVLEVRFVLRNFIKRYEYDSYYTYGDNYWHMVYHYYAVSDWLRDVKPNDTVIGGNLLAVARAYVPGYTATISGANGIASDGYVMAIPAELDISNYLIPSAKRTRPSYNDDTTLPGGAYCYDMPKYPFLPAAFGIESQLDYYLKLEQYKARYNLFVTSVNNLQYAAQWENHFIDLFMFRVPPLVTWVENGGNYQLTNVPMGRSYKLYFVPAAAVDPGELPDLGDEVACVSNPVTVNGDVTVNFP